MKVTVYQKTNRGWEVATQYYDWSGQFKPKSEDEPLSGKITCPGCGKQMGKQYMRFEHKCAGTLTPEPVLVNQIHWARVERQYKENQLKQYVQSVKHRIVTSN